MLLHTSTYYCYFNGVKIGLDIKNKKKIGISLATTQKFVLFFLEFVYNMAKGAKNTTILPSDGEADIVVSMFVQLHWQMFVSHLFKNVQIFQKEQLQSNRQIQKFPEIRA